MRVVVRGYVRLCDFWRRVYVELKIEEIRAFVMRWWHSKMSHWNWSFAHNSVHNLQKTFCEQVKLPPAIWTHLPNGLRKTTYTTFPSRWALVTVPRVTTSFPRNLWAERLGEIVETPGNNNVVIHSTQKRDDHHRITNTLKRSFVYC